MGTLDDMGVVGDAETVLPVVGIGIRQLVILTRGLIRDVEHGLVVGDQFVFLET